MKIRSKYIIVFLLITGWQFFLHSVSAQHNWTVNPAAYSHSGEINAAVVLNSEEVSSGTLGAFVGDECRGIVNGTYFSPTGKTIFILLCYSNISSGEVLSFRYFDAVENKIYPIEETQEFLINMVVGDATQPVTFHALTNLKPTAACPVHSTFASAQDPIAFNLCEIFADPDGDVLAFDAAFSDGSAVNWLSECELDFTVAVTGSSTLTLIASDGLLQSECSYTFSANIAPEVRVPIDYFKVKEGFGSFQIDLDTIFTDQDGDALLYQASAVSQGIVDVTLTGTVVTVAEVASGNTVLTFIASDGEFSTAETADVIVVADGPSIPWQFQASDFLFSGELFAVVQVNSVEVNSGRIGAFVGGECRGYTDGTYFELNEKTIMGLTAYSNLTDGDILTFRYYEPVNEQIVEVEDLIKFVPEMKLGDAQNPIQLNIISDNNIPLVVNPVADQIVSEKFSTMTINIGAIFSDPDNDELSYTASVDNDLVATVSVLGDVLTISETGPGVCNIEIAASDGTFSINDRFNLTISNQNDAPIIVNPIADQSLQEGFASKRINILATFSDPDGDILAYRASSSDETVVRARISGSYLEILEVGFGNATVSVCVSDNEFEVCDELEVFVAEVNFSPVSNCEAYTDTLLIQGYGSWVIDSVCDNFSDPDGDNLIFSATSSNPDVVTVSIDDCLLTITDVGQGDATVSICASDGSLESCCSFDISVVELNVMKFFVMDEELYTGDTISHSSDSGEVVLIVYSNTHWSIEKSGDWFTVEQTNNFNAEIKFEQNNSGEVRSGTIAVRDTQNHVIQFVVYQSKKGIPDAVTVSLADNFKIFPNPVKETLTIESHYFNHFADLTVEIFDVNGQLLEKFGYRSSGEGEFTYSMSKYASGLYFIRVHNDEEEPVILPVIKE